MSRPFADVLRDLAAGRTYEQLTSALGEVVTAVIETRKPGELSLKIKIAPNGESSVKITDEVKAKVPEPTRGATLFFATSSGTLMRNDPRQPDLPLREVVDNTTTKEATHA